MHIVIIGAGAVGGYFGGRLANKGTQVTFLVREKRYRQLTEHGLKVESVHGDFTIQPELALRASDIVKPDVVIVALKNYHLEGALDQIRTVVEQGAVVLPLSNGILHMNRLVSEFGLDNVVGGACYIEATLGANGEVVHTSPMHDIVFGALSGSESVQARLVELEAAFKASGIPVKVSPSIMVDMWQKFIFLTAFSGITAATRKPIGPILADPVTEPFLSDLVREIVTVANAQIDLPEEVFPQVMSRLHSVAKTMTSSLHRDLEKGLPLEIDSLQGAVLSLAKEKGISVPCVSSVYALLHPSVAGNQPGNDL